MSESTDSLKPAETNKLTPDSKTIREALLRLRQLAANLPPVDAAALVRDIREAGSGTS